MAPPTKRPRLTAPPPLQWRTVAGRLRTAPAAGGAYALVSDGLAHWTAEWRPAAGRVEYLVVRTTEQLATAACAQHHLMRHASAALARAGHEDLTQRDTTGPALAWRRGR